ncbi:hypothetical protein EJ02DRAFT_425913 [Clathrospora elynae]|uniref:Uncharacterized protein n=1 Tax=Clathrospora elynae TaxID=706981 RepID=A0A6A5SC90_9PLEO|nr:hypothetical protein EJ02DRAFT_425913 [Clathrospora elynae]
MPYHLDHAHMRYLQQASKRHIDCSTNSIVHKQFAAAKREAEDLEKKKKQLEESDKKLRASTWMLAKSLCSVAKADCLAFASDFHATMPREIRDRVYSYLQVDESDLAYQMILDEEDDLETRTKLEAHTKHWQLPGFVGHDFAYECTQNFYETTTFRMHSWGFKSIKRLLANDYYHFDIVPAISIRYLKIEFYSGNGAQIVFQLVFSEQYDEVHRANGLVIHLKALGSLLYKLKDAAIGFQFEIADDGNTDNHVLSEISNVWDST